MAVNNPKVTFTGEDQTGAAVASVKKGLQDVADQGTSVGTVLKGVFGGGLAMEAVNKAMSLFSDSIKIAADSSPALGRELRGINDEFRGMEAVVGKAILGNKDLMAAFQAVAKVAIPAVVTAVDLIVGVFDVLIDSGKGLFAELLDGFHGLGNAIGLVWQVITGKLTFKDFLAQEATNFTTTITNIGADSKTAGAAIVADAKTTAKGIDDAWTNTNFQKIGEDLSRDLDKRLKDHARMLADLGKTSLYTAEQTKDLNTTLAALENRLKLATATDNQARMEQLARSIERLQMAQENQGRLADKAIKDITDQATAYLELVKNGDLSAMTMIRLQLSMQKVSEKMAELRAQGADAKTILPFQKVLQEFADAGVNIDAKWTTLIQKTKELATKEAIKQEDIGNRAIEAAMAKAERAVGQKFAGALSDDPTRLPTLIATSFGTGFTTTMKAAADVMMNTYNQANNLKAVLGEMAADTVLGLTTAFNAMFTALGQGSNIFAAFGQAVKKSVGEEAIHKGELYIGEGVAKVAQGIWPPNPLAIASGLKEIAAGGLLVALGAKLGGGGASATTSTGGAGGGAGTNNAQAATQAARKSTTTIFIQGSRFLDTSDPNVMDAFMKALQEANGNNLVIAGSFGGVGA